MLFAVTLALKKHSNVLRLVTQPILKSRVESGRCQKSKAADVKAADVAQSGRCCLKQPMIVRKRTMFVQKQPMIDLKRPMCPKAADVFAKSGRCPLRTKAADVEIFYFEIF